MTEIKRDYYEVLEVEKTADQKTIKRAFLKKAQIYHPDVNKEPDAEERFKEINEAYSVLSDVQKRAQYDRFGFDTPQGYSDFSGFGDFFGGGIGDLFESFFGGGTRASASEQKSAQTKGRHLSVRLAVSLEEVATGTTKTISLTRSDTCSDCAGSGSADGKLPERCPDCNGSGYVVQVQQTLMGYVQTQAPCHTCHGTGEVISSPCQTCLGTGRTSIKDAIPVTIDPGIASGTRIVVPQKGEAGLRGDTPGDLLVTIEIKHHDVFERHGDDLYTLLPINVFDALCGTVLKAPSLLETDNAVAHIPRGSKPKDYIVIDGCGLPNYTTHIRGNLICVLDVAYPQDITVEEYEQLEAMRDARNTSETLSSDTEQPKTSKKKKRSQKKPKKGFGRK